MLRAEHKPDDWSLSSMIEPFTPGAWTAEELQAQLDNWAAVKGWTPVKEDVPCKTETPAPTGAAAATDDRGHPIRCEQCIWGDTRLDSTCRPEPQEVTDHVCR